MTASLSVAPPGDRIPENLRDLSILEYVARLGGATPDQVGALAAGVSTPALTLEDSRRVHRRAARLCRQELLQATRVRSTLKALRAQEQWVYTLSVAASSLATQPEALRVVAVMREYMGTTGRLGVPEAWLIKRALPTYADPLNARWRLHQLVKQGILKRERTRPRGQQTLLTLAPAGHKKLIERNQLRGLAYPTPTRPPRVDQSVHHLLVVEAAVRILDHTKGHFVRLYGDESLRSAARKGRQLRRGDQEEILPDGRLLYRTADGKRRKVDIEILVSKYTDTQILKKYESLAPAGTLFFACTPRLCDRTQRLVAHRPILLV